MGVTSTGPHGLRSSGSDRAATRSCASAVLRDDVHELHLVARSGCLDHPAALAQGLLGVVQEDLHFLTGQGPAGGRVPEGAEHPVLVAVAAAVADD
eukprot:8906771-Alexandrium_andersonii.AAC.1